MRQLRIDDAVRLTCDIPRCGLHCGAVGIVRSTWFAPGTSYEVEFDDGESFDRVLLDAGQVELQVPAENRMTDSSLAAMSPAAAR